MSTAAAPARTPTRGYTQVPNSLIENQALLTNAELRLSLVILRREEHPGGVTVSDRNWQEWTGLSARAKEYALAGLRGKNCLTVQYRGDRARFIFERPKWDSFVRAAPAEISRTRTHGRKAVDPKPGAKVHPECRERGCALLAREGEGQLSLVPPSKIAQPVAQGDYNPPVQSYVQLAVTPSTASKFAQPVAQRDPVEDAFRLTLAAVRAVFPMAGVAFLVRLLAAVRVIFSGVTDDELSAAVERAWTMKRTSQTSEGLFLLTVPEAVAAGRRMPAPSKSAGADTGPPGVREGIRTLISRVTAAVRARGGPLLDALPDLEALARIDDWDLFEVPFLERMAAVDARLVELANLTPQESAEIDADLEQLPRQYSALMVERIRKQWREARVLEVMGIPRLGGCSA